MKKSRSKKLPSKSNSSNFRQFLHSSAFCIIISLVFTFVGTLGTLELLKFFVPNTLYLTDNIIFCIVAFLLYLFYHPFFNKLISPKTEHFSRRSFIFVSIFTIIFSIILIIGSQLEFYSQVIWTIGTLAKIIGVCALLFPVLYLITQKLEKLSIGNFVLKPRKHTIITFVSIFAVTILVWLFIFPGIFTYDMASQNEIMYNCLSTGNCYINGISIAHWSLPYGFLLAGFLDFGYQIFHNYEAGLAIAMLIQALFVSYVETRIVLFATKYSRSKVVYILSTLFFCLMPFLIVISLSACQDVLFAGLFALTILNLFESLLDKSYLEHKFTYFKFPLLSFLMCTVRSNGVYCLIFLLIFVLLFVRRKYVDSPTVAQPHFKRNLIILLIIPIVAAFLYDGPFLRALHIEKSSSIQEILGIPSQQLARAYYRAPDSFTEEETASLFEFYDVNGEDFPEYQNYPLISDYTKRALNTSTTSSNLLGYVGLWASVGIKNPKAYIDAFLLNSLGYWYPNKNYNDPRINLDFMNYPGFAMTFTFLDTENHPNMKPIYRQSVNNDVAQKIDGLIFQDDWQKTPLYSTFCSISTYILLSIFTVGYLWLKRHYYLLMPLGLVLGLIFTLFLSPVAIFRYAYPIVMLAPCFIALFYLNSHQPKSK